MKAEKYVIVTERRSPDGAATDGAAHAIVADTRIRFGFGAAGEEIQKLLEVPGLERVRIKIEGKPPEAIFSPSRPWKLLDIKQRIKGLSADND